MATVQRLLDHWNAGVLPVVPSQGSLGASGDLAPLAHLVLPLIGEGEVVMPDGRQLASVDALARAGLAAARARSQGGAGAHQRHANDARHRHGGARTRDAPRRLGRRPWSVVPRSLERVEGRDAPVDSPHPQPSRRDDRGPQRRVVARRLGARRPTPRPTCKTRTRSGACLRCTAPHGTSSKAYGPSSKRR